AGAIVTATTAASIRSAGFDPGVALATHDSYRALDAADALLRTGPTGTNVMDVAFAIAGT
ncbi:MAG TPA: MOFRL family protein, partial [Rhodothermales bacterium]|nr:MOFRL family protein [Rhodothermales bacterium]